MPALPLRPRDRLVIAWVAVAVGVLITLAGVLGVWTQGLFYQHGFPTAATPGEVRQAFAWPALFTSLGSMIVSGALLAAPLGQSWSPRRRLTAWSTFGTVVVLATFLAGHLAMLRVAEILH